MHLIMEHNIYCHIWKVKWARVNPCLEEHLSALKQFLRIMLPPLRLFSGLQTCRLQWTYNWVESTYFHAPLQLSQLSPCPQNKHPLQHLLLWSGAAVIYWLAQDMAHRNIFTHNSYWILSALALAPSPLQELGCRDKGAPSPLQELSWSTYLKSTFSYWKSRKESHLNETYI